MSEPPPELIDRFEQEFGAHFKPEFLRPQVEVGTPVRASAAEVRTDLEDLRRTVAGIADAHGLGLIAASIHRSARWQDQDMQVVAQRLPICGMHVHVGIEDDELRVDILNELVDDGLVGHVDAADPRRGHRRGRSPLPSARPDRGSGHRARRWRRPLPGPGEVVGQPIHKRKTPSF